MTNRRVLVVGTRPGSLGEAIAEELLAYSSSLDRHSTLNGAPVFKAEHSREIRSGRLSIVDYVPCNVLDRTEVLGMLEVIRPTDVVCCVGINLPDEPTEPEITLANLWTQFEMNCYGPVKLLLETLKFWERMVSSLNRPPNTGMNFVVVSSNSAHIARSQSAGYCASKAAVSMAVRCIARANAGNELLTIWGYEPGWINGTPMSEEVIARLGEGEESYLHRIPGARSLSKRELAFTIADALEFPNRSMNGCMFRIDGGEQ